MIASEILVHQTDLAILDGCDGEKGTGAHGVETILTCRYFFHGHGIRGLFEKDLGGGILDLLVAPTSRIDCAISGTCRGEGAAAIVAAKRKRSL